jgi:hypothetical protein
MEARRTTLYGYLGCERYAHDHAMAIVPTGSWTRDPARPNTARIRWKSICQAVVNTIF